MKKFFLLLFLISSLSYAQERHDGQIKPSTASELVDENGNAIGIDNSTRSIQTLSYEHHEIHSGSHYSLCGFTTNNTGTSTVFSVTTPDTTKWTHIVFSADATSQMELYVHEGATVSGGVTNVPMNNNRNSTNLSNLVVIQAPTISDAGTLLPLSGSHGREDTNPAKADALGSVSRDDELVLKQNTTYTWTFTSRGDGNIISFCASWYEHTDKD